MFRIWSSIIVGTWQIDLSILQPVHQKFDPLCLFQWHHLTLSPSGEGGNGMQAKSDAVAAAAVLLAEAAAAGIGGHGDGRAAGTAPAPGKDPRTAAGDVGPSAPGQRV